MKKTTCICLVTLIIMISLTGCFENECKEPILAIESNYDKKIISRSGLYYRGSGSRKLAVCESTMRSVIGTSG